MDTLHTALRPKVEAFSTDKGANWAMSRFYTDMLRSTGGIENQLFPPRLSWAGDKLLMKQDITCKVVYRMKRLIHKMPYGGEVIVSHKMPYMGERSL